MKMRTSVLLAASVLASLPSCVSNEPSGGGASQYQPYESPARATQQQNGNYLVNVNNKFVSFDDAGRLTLFLGSDPVFGFG
jgi:hypothetical protein